MNLHLCKCLAINDPVLRFMGRKTRRGASPVIELPTWSLNDLSTLTIRTTSFSTVFAVYTSFVPRGVKP